MESRGGDPPSAQNDPADSDQERFTPAPRDAFFDSRLNAWVLSRYADVREALQESALRPVSARKKEKQKENQKVPAEAGSAHEALRLQIRTAFSSPALSAWQRQMQRAGVSLSAGDSIELVADFIEPWCATAAEVVTGPAAADRAQLLAAARIVSDSAAEPMDDDLHTRASAADAELESYFRDSALPMAASTFVALSRTLACLVANAWIPLLRQPDAFASLRRNPAKISKAIDELLRLARLPRSVFRCASRAATVGRHAIAEGDLVILELASANHDPLFFPDPDRLDFDRRGAPHLALGFGPHACAGAPLIRMAAVTATQAFVENFGGFEIVDRIEWRGGSGFRFAAALHLHAAAR